MCKKAFCQESEAELGAVDDVEIIELDDDNNVFVDSFNAVDSSIFVESGKFVAPGDTGDGVAKMDQITCVCNSVLPFSACRFSPFNVFCGTQVLYVHSAGGFSL